MDYSSKYKDLERVYGSNYLELINNKKIILVGLDVLGIDILEKIILSGVKIIYIIDEGLVSITDVNLSSYYINEDIGKCKSNVIMKHFVKNDNLNVISFRGNLSEDFLKDSLLIFSNYNIKDSIKFNNICRKINCKMILGNTFGLFGFVFVDGIKHEVIKNELNKFNPLRISSVSDEGIVITFHDYPHNLKHDNKILFSNLDGNNLGYLKSKFWDIEILSKNCFKLLDFDCPDNFIFSNGCIHLKIEKEKIEFNSLENELENNLTINGKILEDVVSEEYKLLDIYKMIFNFINDNEYDDNSWSESMDNLINEYDTKTKKLLRCGNIIFPSVIKLFSSVIVSEMIKLVTHKYTPINQWWFWNDISIVPDEKPEKLSLTKYGKLFGFEFDNSLSKSNILIIGAGYNCIQLLDILSSYEINKYNGIIDILDYDKINIDCTLYSERNIDNFKADIICKKYKTIFKNISSINKKLDLYDKKIFLKYDVIINTINNNIIKRNIAEECFRNNKAYFSLFNDENTIQSIPIIPFSTDLYSNIVQIEKELSFPSCIVGNFPNNILHTLFWSLEDYNILKNTINNIKLLKNNKELNDNSESMLKSIKFFAIDRKLLSLKDCLFCATDLWFEKFRSNIIKLLHNLPPDYKSDDNKYYWSGGKICPQIIDFDINNKYIMEYIFVTTSILALCSNISLEFNNDDLKKLLESYTPKEFKVNVNNNNSDDIDYKLPDDLIIEGEYNFPDFYYRDSNNLQLLYLKSVANCRALNYNIETIGIYDAKYYIGKMKTELSQNLLLDNISSASIGLLSLEIIKYFLNLSSSDKLVYKKSKLNFNDLYNNEYLDVEKESVELINSIEISCWEKFELNDDCTLDNFIKKYNKKFGIEISMILYGNRMFYTGSDDDNNKKLSEIFKSKYKKNIKEEEIYLILLDDDDTEIPDIKVLIK